MQELVNLVKKKREMRYDNVIFISGLTGQGKSRFSWVFLHKFKDFNVEKQLTYSRKETIDLIENQKSGYVWNDELVGAGYRRHFYLPDQISLIQSLTKARNNFNIVVGCIPNFNSLDSELKKLCCLHINIPQRGRAILHCPLVGRIFNDDPFDTKFNQKQEEKWSLKKLKHPEFEIPHHRYSTYIGEIHFSGFPKKQEEYYEQLKDRKKAEADSLESPSKENTSDPNFYEKVLGMVKERKLDENELLKICIFNDKKLSSVKVRLNQMLKDEGSKQTLNDFLNPSKKTTDNSIINNESDLNLR